MPLNTTLVSPPLNTNTFDATNSAEPFLGTNTVFEFVIVMLKPPIRNSTRSLIQTPAK